MLVRLVLARAWHVEVLGPSVGLHTEAELGDLAWLAILFALGWVLEIEITSDVVSVGCWRVLVAAQLSANSVSDLDTL